MKDNAVQKINKFGNISQILVNITMAVIGMAAILCFVGAVTCLFLPKNLLEVKYDDQMDITMDFTGFNSSFSKDDITNLQNELTGGNSGVSFNNNSYSVDDVTFTDHSFIMKGSTGETGFTLRGISLALFTATLLLATTWATLLFIGKLCKELKVCETPFSETIIKKLNCVAISLIPMCVMISLGTSIIKSILAGGTTIALNLNVGSIIMIILIFGLVQIFKYGAMLQRESDETL